jgi:hypothetical protein
MSGRCDDDVAAATTVGSLGPPVWPAVPLVCRH